MLAPDLILAFVLLDITLILLLARALGALARKVGQPTVVGEIVAGVLLGPTLLGPTLFVWGGSPTFLHCDQSLAPGALPSISACLFPPQARSVLGILGQIALVFYMFLVGLELDWDLLRGKGKGIVSVAAGAVAVPIALAFVIGPLLYGARFVPNFGTPDAPSQASFTLMVAAMLSVTAFPVMARILQEKKLTASAMGSIGVASAAVVTVLMFLTVAVAAGVATRQGSERLVLKFVIAAVFIVVLFGVVRPLLVPLGRVYEARGAMTPGMFATVLILLFASAYVADRIGINVIVGSFLFGAVLPARQALFREMAARLSDLTAIVLLPIFLAFSGLNTDFTLWGLFALGGTALFLVAGIAGKWAGSAVFARVGGLSWAEGNVLGILMNCRGLLVLVVALIGLNQGVINPAFQVAGVLMALVTTAMTGPLIDAFLPRVKEAVPVNPDRDVLAAAPPEAYRVLAAVDDLERVSILASAAEALAGGRRPAEVVLVAALPLPSNDEMTSGINDAERDVGRALRALRGAEHQAPAGLAVTPVAFTTADVAGDLARIARERQCDVLLLGWHGRGGPPRSLQRRARRLLEQSSCHVVVYCDAALDREGFHAGPVVAADLPGTGDEVALAMADSIGAAEGSAVERIEVGFGEAEQLVEASRRASALVVAAGVGDPGPGHLFGALSDTVVAEAECPVYVVRARAAVAAPVAPAP